MNAKDETIIDGELMEQEETIVEIADNNGSEDTLLDAFSDDETCIEAEDEGALAHGVGNGRSTSQAGRGDKDGKGSSNATAVVIGSTVGAAVAGFAPHVVAAVIDNGSSTPDAQQRVATNTGNGASAAQHAQHDDSDIDTYEITADDIEVVGIDDGSHIGSDIRIENVSMGGEDYMVIDIDSDDIIEAFPDEVSLVGDEDVSNIEITIDGEVVDGEAMANAVESEGGLDVEIDADIDESYDLGTDSNSFDIV